MNSQRRNPPPPLLIVHSFFLPLGNGDFFFPTSTHGVMEEARRTKNYRLILD